MRLAIAVPAHDHVPAVFANDLARHADRVWSNVQKGDGCWRWTGHLVAKRYGQIWIDGAHRSAHRVAWELTHGPIPAGFCVCHNMADMMAKGRGRNIPADRRRAKAHCTQGHAYSEANTYVDRKGRRSCRACGNARLRAARAAGRRL